MHFNRRMIIAGSGAALLCGSLRAADAPTAKSLIISGAGPVIGTQRDGINIFQGIPFAKPPIGALRFRPPQPLPPWRDPLDATAFGSAPMQPRMAMIAIPGAFSEDCLTLNIWAPAAPGPHPVLFSIYGGGNFIGAASQPGYDGTAFARQGVVFVSANYRLGAFGFLELGGIDPAYAGSSLNGLRDIEAALRWVRDNIPAFGGNPDEVTLAGISAGGKNQCALAAMSSAKGLFRRMTVMSGGGETVFRSIKEAMPVARALLSAAGASSVAELVALPAGRLLEAQGTVLAGASRGFPFRPTVDGSVLPYAPAEAARRGLTAKLDIVVGTARDETALTLPPALAARPFAAHQLANVNLDQMLAVQTRYDHLLGGLPLAERRVRQLTAEEYWIPSLRFAEAHASAGGRVWMYRFDWAAASGPFAGRAPHGSDSPFLYGDARAAFLPMSDAAKAAISRVQRMWAGWARTGRIRLAGAPDWPLYDLRRRRTFILDEHPHVESDPRGDERRLWDGIL